jgi:hypothetical protein
MGWILDESDYLTFNHIQKFAPVTVMMVGGGLTSLTALVGCFGAISFKRPILNMVIFEFSINLNKAIQIFPPTVRRFAAIGFVSTIRRFHRSPRQQTHLLGVELSTKSRHARNAPKIPFTEYSGN